MYKAPWQETAAQPEPMVTLTPVLYGSVFTNPTYTTMAIDDILGGNETLESLQDLVLDYEYLHGRSAFLHSGWFLEGLRSY